VCNFGWIKPHCELESLYNRLKLESVLLADSFYSFQRYETRDGFRGWQNLKFALFWNSSACFLDASRTIRIPRF